jgi:hypothetical protein
VGERVRLFVDTTASSFHVEAFRLGWYGGDGGRRIWTSGVVPGVRQRPPRMNAKTRMVEAGWNESLAFRVGEDRVQGTNLLKLVSSTGGQAYDAQRSCGRWRRDRPASITPHSRTPPTSGTG